MESQKNHIFLATLTYNNEMLPVHVCSNGRRIRYASYDDLNSVIRKLRRDYMLPRPFRYFAVSELGSKKGRPHFHVCFFLPKYQSDTFDTCMNMEYSIFHTLKDAWCRNVGSRKFPIWKPLFTYHRILTRQGVRTSYDLKYISPRFSSNGTEDVSWYVLKYMLKPSDRAKRLQQALRLNLEPSEYNEVWNKVKPRIFKSLDFGLSRIPEVGQYLHRNVDVFSDCYPYPTFVSPTDGKVYPLSRFYRSKGNIFDVQLATKFALMNPPDEYIPEYDPDSIVDQKIKRFNEVKQITDNDVFEDERLFT